MKQPALRKYKLLILGLVLVGSLWALGFAINGVGELAKPYAGAIARKNRRTYDAMYDSAMVSIRDNKLDEAEEQLDEAIKFAEETYGPDNFAVGDLLYVLGGLYYAQERFADAKRCFVRQLAIFENEYGEHAEELGDCLVGLTRVSLGLGDEGIGVKYARRALAVAEAHSVPTDSVLLRALDNLAEALEGTGQYQQAWSLRERVLSKRTENVSTKSVELGKEMCSAARNAEHRGELRDAKRLYESCLTLLGKYADTSDAFFVEAQREYKNFTMKEGN